LPLLPHVRAVLLGGPADFFFTVNFCRRRKRHSVAALTVKSKRWRNSARLASGCCATARRTSSARASRAGRRGVPAWRGATAPVWRRRWRRRLTQALLTRYLRATWEGGRPSSQSARMRTRRSIEYALIAGPPGRADVLAEESPRWLHFHAKRTSI